MPPQTNKLANVKECLHKMKLNLQPNFQNWRNIELKTPTKKTKKIASDIYTKRSHKKHVVLHPISVITMLPNDWYNCAKFQFFPNGIFHAITLLGTNRAKNKFQSLRNFPCHNLNGMENSLS